jgi:hypothetical protein
MDASGYSMGVVLIKGGKPICYPSKMFHGGVLEYTMDDRELYAPVQDIKKWKHYLMGNEIIIHNNH